MRTRNSVKFIWAFPLFVALLLFVNVACSTKTSPPRVAATVATYGTTLMQGVRASQDAVITAEKTGALPRNAAVKSMEVFQRIGQNGEKVKGLLDKLLLLSPGSAEAQTVAQQVQALLDLIDSDLFAAVVPISDETTRTQVSALASEVSKTISIINREVLGVK